MNDADTILDYIQSELLLEPVDPPLQADDNLLVRSPIDSLGVVQLVAFLEQSFNVRIRPGEVTLKHFRSANTMLALIDRKQAGA